MIYGETLLVSNDSIYLVLFILVMAVATFITRALPFLLLKNRGDHPVIAYLGTFLPPAIMLLLLIYCFKDIDLSGPQSGLAESVSLAAVAILHLIFKHPLVSIGAGTILYMLLQRT